jgi:hypothetical protein
MKEKIMLYLVFAILGLQLNAQKRYYSGFDNSTEKAGWKEFREGVTGSYNWNYSSFEPYSMMDCLSHDYPVGGTLVTDDWFVSPPFNFSSGGKIDSLRYNFSGFSVPSTDDTLAIYLLVGSQNPSLATNKILLFDYRDTNYKRTNTWLKKTNVIIPSKVGSCYIAIKYRTISHWLTVKFDNISITSNALSSIENSQADMFKVFPNPSNSELTIRVSNSLNALASTFILYNSEGKEVCNKQFVNELKLDISNLSKGVYSYRILMDSKSSVENKLLIVN